MTKRQEKLLKIIVEEFIKSADPIGSNFLIQNYFKELSSATIRNECLKLESLGMLDKTHSSSGRVPSSKGYKYYIEKLMDEDIPPKLKSQFDEILNNNSYSYDQVIKKSLVLITEITKSTSVLFEKKEMNDYLAKIEIIPISNNKVVTLIITDSGKVKNQIIDLTETPDILKDINYCVEIFNERLKGTKLIDLKTKASTIFPVLESYIRKYGIALQIFFESLFSFVNEKEKEIIGSNNILANPEFNKIDKMKKLLNFLENKSVFELIAKQTHEKKKNILIDFIEKDRKAEIGEGLSIISTEIGIGSNTNNIALLGPNRMDYEKIINILDYIKIEIEKKYKTK